MTATYPVKERIVQAVQAALLQITVAHGYTLDVTEVVRPRRTGEKFAPVANGIRLMQGDEQPAPTEDLIGNPPVIGRRLALAIDLVVRLSDRATEPMDQVLNAFEADARKALMAEPQLGGLALRIELGPTEYPEASEGVEGVTVWAYVIYRTPENDPYTAA